MTIHIPPSPPGIRGNAERLPVHEVMRLRAAAQHAKRIYPGALGELVSRELAASAELGLTLGMDSVITRLARDVLATSAEDCSRFNATF